MPSSAVPARQWHLVTAARGRRRKWRLSPVTSFALFFTPAREISRARSAVRAANKASGYRLDLFPRACSLRCEALRTYADGATDQNSSLVLFSRHLDGNQLCCTWNEVNTCITGFSIGSPYVSSHLLIVHAQASRRRSRPYYATGYPVLIFNCGVPTGSFRLPSLRTARRQAPIH